MSAHPPPAPPRGPDGAPTPGDGRPARRVDASMDLLLQILRQPLDPDYARVAARGGTPTRRPWLLGVAAVAVGILFAVGAVQTTRSAPAVQTERAELIDRVQAAGTAQDELRARATAVAAENAALRTAALGGDAGARALERRLTALEARVGTVAVTGPGMRITVDDAGSDAQGRDRVLDLDLQILANGLWQSGAEAVSVNGHRLSAVTAIRSAGDAITVDYRSLTRPYVVEAVGDPRTLPATLATSAAGTWWHDLAQNRAMRYDVADAGELTLPADPGLTLRWASAVTS